MAGTIGYVFLIAMAATSSNRAFRWLGRKRWKALHTLGSYWIGAVFAYDYLPWYDCDIYYTTFSSLVATAMTLRMVALLAPVKR